MELTKNQIVVFSNGYKAGNLEAVWDRKRGAFCVVTDDLDEEGNRIRIYSTTVIEKQSMKKRKFIPSKKNCTMQIFPVSETEKSYQVPEGSNGKIGNCKEYYKWIAKSICWIDETGNIFAPKWA